MEGSTLQGKTKHSRTKHNNLGTKIPQQILEGSELIRRRRVTSNGKNCRIITIKYSCCTIKRTDDIITLQPQLRQQKMYQSTDTVSTSCPHLYIVILAENKLSTVYCFYFTIILAHYQVTPSIPLKKRAPLVSSHVNYYEIKYIVFCLFACSCHA